MTSAELQQVDVGSWFNQAHSELARDEYSFQTVPTLNQVFEQLNRHPNRPEAVYVEMKTDQSQESYGELCLAVAQFIKDHRMLGRVVVVSFNLKAVA